MWEFSDWSGNGFQREHKSNVRREKKSKEVKCSLGQL